MPRKPNPEQIDDENLEWTQEDFRRARPAREVLPDLIGHEAAGSLLKRRPGQRGPQKAPTKEQVTLRLDSEVLAHFKAQGPGWQTRLNEALKRILKAEKGL